MKRVHKFKGFLRRIRSFVIVAIVFLSSLLCFTACDINKNPLCIRIVYKPFPTTVVGTMSSGHQVTFYYNHMTTQSENMAKNILANLSAKYGFGMANNSTYFTAQERMTDAVRPKNEVDYQTKFNMLNYDGDEPYSLKETTREMFASELASMTNVCLYNDYNSGGVTRYTLVLSNKPLYSVDWNIDEILTFDNLTKTYSVAVATNIFTSANLQQLTYNKEPEKLRENDEIPLNSALRFVNNQLIGSKKDVVAYIFVGNFVGSSTSGNSFNGIVNARKFVESLYQNNDIGLIEGGFKSANNLMYEGATVALTKTSWNYALGETASTPAAYVGDFVNTNCKDFQVELVKTMLVGDGDLPTDANFGNEPVDIKAIYNNYKATKKNSYYNDFLKYACGYLDYQGISYRDYDNIQKLIATTVIGTNNLPSDFDEVYDGIYEFLANKMPEEPCVFVRDIAYDEFSSREEDDGSGNKVPILTLGYVQSIAIGSTDDAKDFFQIGYLIEFKFPEGYDYNYDLYLRYRDKDELIERPFIPDPDYLEDELIMVSYNDVTIDGGSLIRLGKTTDTTFPFGLDYGGATSASFPNAVVTKIYKTFKCSNPSGVIKKRAIVYEDDTSNYIELVFGCDDPFHLPTFTMYGCL